jgi:hypothetical protein
MVLTGATARAADDAYEVKPSPVKATLGEKATASVTIATKKGWHLNAEAPLTLKLTPGPGITVEKPRLGTGRPGSQQRFQRAFRRGLVASQAGTWRGAGRGRLRHLPRDPLPPDQGEAGHRRRGEPARRVRKIAGQIPQEVSLGAPSFRAIKA